MLYKVGRFLQIVGMVLLPLAIAGQATGKHDVQWMLALCTIGVLVFFVGWLIQQAGKPQ
jgi:hypothetical protein